MIETCSVLGKNMLQMKETKSYAQIIQSATTHWKINNIFFKKIFYLSVLICASVDVIDPCRESYYGGQRVFDKSSLWLYLQEGAKERERERDNQS